MNNHIKIHSSDSVGVAATALPAGTVIPVDGGVGIRNELWIIPTVGCVNAIGSRIKDRFLMETVGKTELGRMPEGIDDVQVFTHPYGCGQEGYDAENTENALAMAVRHPNCGGALVLGLGCEDIRIEVFKKTLEALGGFDPQRVLFLETQQVEDEIPLGTSMLHRLYEAARFDRREEVPMSALRIGLECGGSDGFSGLTGNLDGGISTLEEKALGCTQKGGQSKVESVLTYAAPIQRPGFHLLWAPGSDTAGTTALGLCCQMVVFTTGRGTPYGGFVPTVKVATNTPMYQKKRKWNDFNAGRLLEDVPMRALARELIDLILEIAGGRLTSAEKNGFKEFVIWKNGISE